MEESRLTNNLYSYLEAECAKKNVTLHAIAKAAGVNHQLLYQWRERTPKTLLIVDNILQELDKL